MKIPWSDGVLDRFQQGVFADALVTAQHQCVVDLVAGMLPVMRQPANDVVGVVRVDFVHVVEPGGGLAACRPARCAAADTG